LHEAPPGELAHQMLLKRAAGDLDLLVLDALYARGVDGRGAAGRGRFRAMALGVTLLRLFEQFRPGKHTSSAEERGGEQELSSETGRAAYFVRRSMTVLIASWSLMMVLSRGVASSAAHTMSQRGSSSVWSEERRDTFECVGWQRGAYIPGRAERNMTPSRTRLSPR